MVGSLRQAAPIKCDNNHVRLPDGQSLPGRPLGPGEESPVSTGQRAG